MDQGKNSNKYPRTIVIDGMDRTSTSYDRVKHISINGERLVDRMNKFSTQPMFLEHFDITLITKSTETLEYILNPA